MKRHWIFLFFLIAPILLFSQEVNDDYLTSQSPSWEILLREWMTEEDIEYGEDTFDQLSAIADNKLDLNQVTREDLEQLPFLSAQQIAGIVEYIDRYKPLRSLNELLMIESLDYNVRLLLRHFVFVGDASPQVDKPSLASMLKDGRHTLMGTIKIPMYERKGDRTAYLGYPYRHDFRYQFSYRDNIKFGLTGAQDSGEPFFANKNRCGYDHYSYYFQLRQMGCMEELNVGMYRVQFGMGLVMNTGFRLGKLSILQSLGRSSHVLTAHSSRSSTNYLRGAASTLRLSKKWQFTAFVSNTPLDATLNDDYTIRTIDNDGYHRTMTELAKKNNSSITDLGLRLGWKKHGRLGIGSFNVNAVYSHFDREIVPFNGASSQNYRRYALAGSDFFNVSLDYGYTNYRLSFSGETALNRIGALATLHTLSYSFSDQWSVMLLHRYYDKRYTAFHAYAFSEGNNTQNEHGIYLGAKWIPSRTTLFQAYVDYAYFPWDRYQITAGSQSVDALLCARTLIFNKVIIEGRYRFRLQQRDNDNHTLLQNRYGQYARLRVILSPTPSLSMLTQADAVSIDNRVARSRGVMVSQQASFQHRWLKLSANIGWFHTDDYDSRLYQHEPSVLYDFSFPSYYGHGIRYALTARAEVGSFTLSAKYGTTDYFDRSVISSGNQQIGHSSMTDLLLQLRVII